ncbi:MAG: hypothetical protein WCU88_06405 [Elusimicrobiota bacterium]|jgi:hypothetical protein
MPRKDFHTFLFTVLFAAAIPASAQVIVLPAFKPVIPSIVSPVWLPGPRIPFTPWTTQVQNPLPAVDALKPLPQIEIILPEESAAPIIVDVHLKEETQEVPAKKAPKTQLLKKTVPQSFLRAQERGRTGGMDSETLDKSFDGTSSESSSAPVYAEEDANVHPVRIQTLPEWDLEQDLGIR